MVFVYEYDDLCNPANLFKLNFLRLYLSKLILYKKLPLTLVVKIIVVIC